MERPVREIPGRQKYTGCLRTFFVSFRSQLPDFYIPKRNETKKKSKSFSVNMNNIVNKLFPKKPKYGIFED